MSISSCGVRRQPHIALKLATLSHWWSELWWFTTSSCSFLELAKRHRWSNRCNWWIQPRTLFPSSSLTWSTFSSFKRAIRKSICPTTQRPSGTSKCGWWPTACNQTSDPAASRISVWTSRRSKFGTIWTVKVSSPFVTSRLIASSHHPTVFFRTRHFHLRFWSAMV